LQPVFVALALLACPLGMGLMMLLMGRGITLRRKAETRRPSRADDLAVLRLEHATMGERIAELEAEECVDPPARR